jgi:CRISPR system Cascade subunit CasA
LAYHPEGASLFETLLAGLVPPERQVRREQDQCPWEWEELPGPDGLPPALTGPCSRLTARLGSRAAVRTRPRGLLAGAGCLHHLGLPAGPRCPAGRRLPGLAISKQGNRYPRPADSGRALWRDVDALLLIDPPGLAQPKRPAVFDWADEVSTELRVRALGFEQDGQAKDPRFVDGVTSPILAFVEKQPARTHPAVGRLRALGERFGNRLDRALRRA